MTVPRSKTTPPALFAASVVTPATWLAIVPTDKEAIIGVMAVAVPLVESALAMVSTVNTRYVSLPLFSMVQILTNYSNLCKNLAVALVPPPASKPALAVVMIRMPSPGSEDPLEAEPHRGDHAVTIETLVMLPPTALLLGLVTVTAVVMTTAEAATATMAAETDRPQLLLGNSSSNNSSPMRHTASKLPATARTPDMLATAATAPRLAWLPRLPRACPRAVLGLMHPRASLVLTR